MVIFKAYSSILLSTVAVAFLLVSCGSTQPNQENISSTNPSTSLSSSLTSKATGLTKEDKDFRDQFVRNDKYIVFFLTNTDVYKADGLNKGKDANKNFSFVGELPELFGKINQDSSRKYAFGLPGPMLLTQSVSEMQDEVESAFDLAEKYNVPVYFQLDDCNNYTSQFGNGSSIKYTDNPDWCEWVSFPKAGEQWGGQSNGRLPYFWYNWGDWRFVKGFPCYSSEGFKTYVVSQLKDGVLKPLTERYRKLREAGKEYLFAGMAIGWETHIPDYSSNNTLSNIQTTNLPKAITGDAQMQMWEAARYGYNSLHNLGKTTYDREALYGVIHDYSELLAKTSFDAGIPKSKIFTHIIGYKSANQIIESTFSPPIRVAVNDYSIPGFTLNPISCPYNLDVLTQEIKKADPTQKYFGSVESYALGVDGSYEQATKYFSEMFTKGALMVSVFGWGTEPVSSAFAVSHSPASPFVKAAGDWMQNKYS